MIFLFTASGPLIVATGMLLGVQIVFWAGVVICGINLFMNLAYGVMNFPLIPGLMMWVGGAALTPWFWGAALGLVCWTALESAGEVFSLFARRAAQRKEDARLKTPPRLPTRCGTTLFRGSAESQIATVAAWNKREEEYCAWVDAHPNPKSEWVERAESIRDSHQFVRELSMKDR